MGRVQGRQGRHNLLRSAATADRMVWGGPPPPQGNAVVGYGVGRSGRPADPRRPQAPSRLIAQGKGVPRKPGRGPQAGKKGPTRRNEPEPRRARSGWGIRPGTAKHAPTHASHRAPRALSQRQASPALKLVWDLRQADRANAIGTLLRRRSGAGVASGSRLGLISATAGADAMPAAQAGGQPDRTYDRIDTSLASVGTGGDRGKRS